MRDHANANIRRASRGCAAFLGVFVFAMTAGSTTANAQPGKGSLSWTPTPIKSGQAVLNDVDTRADATWAVGAELVDGFQDERPVALRWDGSHWSTTQQPVHSNSTLESVAVVGADDVWAVGEDRSDPSQPRPLVLHWDGDTWQIVPGPSVPTGSFDDVAAGPDGAIWATGWANVDGIEHAVVYKFANGSWQPLTTGLEQSINGNTLAVVGNDEAWLGLNAGLAHYRDDKWELVGDVPTDGSQIPTGLAAAGPNDIWAVGVNHTGGPEGERPLALHYNGSSWTRVAAPRESSQLYDVALHNGRPVAVGESFVTSGDVTVAEPLVLELRGSKLVRAATPTDAEGTLTTVDAAGARLWTAGFVIDAATGAFSPLAAFAEN